MKDQDKFYLDSKKDGNPELIMYRRYVYGDPIKLSIGFSILPELWDSTTQRPTTDKKILQEYLKENTTLRTQLKNIETRINNFREESAAYLQTQFLNKKEIDKYAFKDHLRATVKTSDRNKKTESNKVNSLDYSYITGYSNKFLNEITTGERKYLKKEKGKKIKVHYGYG